MFRRDFHLRSAGPGDDAIVLHRAVKVEPSDMTALQPIDVGKLATNDDDGIHTAVEGGVKPVRYALGACIRALPQTPHLRCGFTGPADVCLSTSGAMPGCALIETPATPSLPTLTLSPGRGNQHAYPPSPEGERVEVRWTINQTPASPIMLPPIFHFSSRRGRRRLPSISSPSPPVGGSYRPRTAWRHRAPSLCEPAAP